MTDYEIFLAIGSFAFGVAITETVHMGIRLLKNIDLKDVSKK